MYGDKLQQAINTINNYLKQGSTIHLWDTNNPDESLELNEDSYLEFITFEMDWEEE